MLRSSYQSKEELRRYNNNAIYPLPPIHIVDHKGQISEESGERETHTGCEGRTVQTSGEGNKTTPLHFGQVTQ